MIGVGVIGYGYWGPNILRNFVEAINCSVLKLADLSQAPLARAQSRYPGLPVTTDPRDIFTDSKIDAVAIMTPVDTHFDLAMQALSSNKHVLLAKPMTSTAEQAHLLIEEAAKRQLILMVDHTFIYTDAVRKSRELVEKKELGEVLYYDAVRVNLGLFQHDVDVIWDLAPHDISIFDFVIGVEPVAVSATGISHVHGKPENTAFLSLLFDQPLIGHIHVNWLAPVKVRKTLIGGSKKMIVYDDLEPSEKIKVYDKGITVTNDPQQRHDMLVGYRSGDMWAPQLDTAEALRSEIAHFLSCIAEKKTPQTSGEAGSRVVKILEAASKSMRQQGVPVPLKRNI